MNLKIDYLNVDEIRPYEKNPRKHDVDQIKKIADSITEFNFTNPVLIDENNVLLAGHGRLLAAKKLKIEKVPCVRITYLTESQKKAYRIADNNLTLLGDWDIDLLGLDIDMTCNRGRCRIGTRCCFARLIICRRALNDNLALTKKVA